MVKEGNSIVTTLVSTLDTNEHNGVEVKINISYAHRYLEALKSISFFPNIYIDTEYQEGKNINNINIKRFKNFAVGSVEFEDRLLLGNVLYPCNTNSLSIYTVNFIRNLNYSGIVLKFDIGELNITPNRENIIYTSETIKKIEDKVEEVKKEMFNIINSYISSDTNDIIEYDKKINDNTFFNFMDNSINITSTYYNKSYSSININILGNDFTKNITYKGKSFSKLVTNNLSRLCLEYKDNVIGIVTDDKVLRVKNTKNVPSHYINMCKVEYPKIIIVTPGFRFTSIIKSFLVENYNNYVVIESPINNSTDYKQELIDRQFSVSSPDFYDLLDLYKDLKAWQVDKAEIIDFNTNSTFLKYKEDVKNNKVVNEVLSKDIIIYSYYNSRSKDYTFKLKITFDSWDKVKNYIKNSQHGIIIDNIREDNLSLAYIAISLNTELITASKPVVEKLKELSYSNFITKEKLLSNRKLIIYNTVFKNLTLFDCTKHIKEALPLRYKKDIDEMLSIYNSGFNYETRRFVSNTNLPIDEHCKKLCDILNYYSKIINTEYLDLKDDNVVDVYELSLYNIAILSAIKKKLLRINYNYYKQLTNSKIIKVLCKK